MLSVSWAGTHYKCVPFSCCARLGSKLPAKVGNSSKTFEARRGEKSESSSSSEEEEKKTGAGDMEQDTGDLIQQ